jgi:predicted TIM-barrel fold metal-dependent hydrolase
MAEARAFLERLPVSAADRERIAHGNAERLLGL